MNLKRKIAKTLFKLANSLSPEFSPYTHLPIPYTESVRRVSRMQVQIRTSMELINENPKVNEYDKQLISRNLAESLLDKGYIEFASEIDSAGHPTHRTMTGTILIVEPQNKLI